MILLSDDNPTRITPVVTMGLIALNTLVFPYQLSLSPRKIQMFVYQYEVILSVVFGSRISLCTATVSGNLKFGIRVAAESLGSLTSEDSWVDCFWQGCSSSGQSAFSIHHIAMLVTSIAGVTDPFPRT